MSILTLTSLPLVLALRYLLSASSIYPSIQFIMASPDIQMLKRTYKEDENYLILGSDEPEERSMSLVFRQGSLQWHVRVVFRGKNGIITRKNFLARRKAFEALISMIIFSSLPLLADTVTKDRCSTAAALVILLLLPEASRQTSRFFYKLRTR